MNAEIKRPKSWIDPIREAEAVKPCGSRIKRDRHGQGGDQLMPRMTPLDCIALSAVIGLGALLSYVALVIV